MPIMDGITSTQKCREKYHLKRLPIVIVTAELGEEIQNQARNAGANVVISKPDSASDILSAISKSEVSSSDLHSCKRSNTNLNV